MVEVLSPTTARHDRPPRGKKFKAYEQYGVSHYWLVDTRRRTIATYERQGNRLVATTLHDGDTLCCPLFPEFGLAVAQLFRPR